MRFGVRELGVVTLLLASAVVSLSPQPDLADGFTMKTPTKQTDGGGHYNIGRAAMYLDQAAKDWRAYTRPRGDCTSCHSTYAYLMARSGKAGADASDATTLQSILAQVRKRVQDDDTAAPWYRSQREEPSRQTETIMNALALTIYDASRGNSLHHVTRKALDKMWTVRGKKWVRNRWEPGNASPVWRWLDFDLGPYESKREDAAGAALALIATGTAPGAYARSPIATQGTAVVRKWLKQHPSPLLHHRMLLLWADTVTPGVLTPAAKKQIIADIRQKKNFYGGWSTPALYAPVASEVIAESDGYGTGFAVFILRKAGVPLEDDAIQSGLQWLKQNQRSSGAWHSLTVNPGLHEATKPIPARFPTHLGTAFALMALEACGETSSPTQA